MSDPIRIGLLGAGGRMGAAITRCAAEQDDLAIVAAVTSPDDPLLGRDPGRAHGVDPLDIPLTTDPSELAKAQVVLDFSQPEATLAALGHEALGGLAWVLGTTGFSAQQEARLELEAGTRPLLRASNTSVGAALMHLLLERAARALPDADIEIVETHHRHKRDAPSGTALALAKTATEARADAAVVLGRSGIAPRSDREIGVSAVRGGNVVGEHRVLFLVDDELVELRHEVTDRRCFARGALRAARYLARPGKTPGLYGMADVLAHLA